MNRTLIDYKPISARLAAQRAKQEAQQRQQMAITRLILSLHPILIGGAR